MRLEKIATLAEILAQGKLGPLHEHSSLIQQLETLLGFYLDQRLRQLVQVAAYREGTLILACSNSTAVGQLRYLSRIYIQQLRQHSEFCELKRIQAVIAHTSLTSRQSPARPRLRRLTPATAKLLRELSKDLASGEVSEALQRLASHEETAEEVKQGHSS